MVTGVAGAGNALAGIGVGHTIEALGMVAGLAGAGRGAVHYRAAAVAGAGHPIAGRDLRIVRIDGAGFAASQAANQHEREQRHYQPNRSVRTEHVRSSLAAGPANPPNRMAEISFLVNCSVMMVEFKQDVFGVAQKRFC
jgi:hypothetical protein